MKSKVLIVDDNLNNLRLLKEILEDENYDVFTESDSREVIKAACNIKPQVILLDIMMTGIDGFEICRLLKEDIETKDIIVIMVTAKVEGIDIKKAMDLGAFDYIKKPIDEIEVIARVQTALRYYNKQVALEQLAMKDSLTGVYNHAQLIERLERELIRCERDNTSLAFVMLDIDFFKKINDTYGHLYGDMILKEMVMLLSNTIRKYDTLGRYGGEEFGIVIPNIGYEDAVKLCERLRATIEGHKFNLDSQSIKITVSMGMCFKEFNINMSTMEAVRIADNSLYEAKRLGRNKVIVAKHI